MKQENLDRAALYGANILFRPRMDDLPEESARRLKAIFPPHGPDIIIDAAGFEVTVQVRRRALQCWSSRSRRRSAGGQSPRPLLRCC